VFVSLTTADTSGQPSENAKAVAQEMERWLRETEGYEGFMLLAGDERALGLVFWESREVAERHAEARKQFRERMLGIAGVTIEDVVGYEVVYASLGPRLTSGIS
jgi:heme-degrading monooxygenase HmoA